MYETLGRLEARGAVLVNRSEPVRYAAVPHASLLAELRSRFNADLESAASAQDRLPVRQEPGLVWSLRGAVLGAQDFAKRHDRFNVGVVLRQQVKRLLLKVDVNVSCRSYQPARTNSPCGCIATKRQEIVQ